MLPNEIAAYLVPFVGPDFVKLNMQCLVEFNPVGNVNKKLVNDIMNHYAAKGDVDAIDYMLANGYEYSPYILYLAARNGHMSVLRYFKQKGYSLSEESVSIGAVDGGCFEMLKWLTKKGYKFRNIHSMSKRAAFYGHLDILEWIDKDGFKFNFLRLIDSAVQGNQLEVIEWLCTISPYRKKMEMYILRAVTKYGNLSICKWAAEEKKIKLCCRTLADAALYGDVPLFNYVLAKVEGRHSIVFKNAIWGKKIEMVRRLIQLIWPISPKIFAKVITLNNLDIIKEMKEIGYEWDHKMGCVAVRKKKYFPILEWLHSQGAQFDGLTCRNAVAHNNFDALKWLVENGIEFYKDNILQIAVCRGCGGNLEIIDWLFNHGAIVDTSMVNIAARNGYIHVLKWTKEHGVLWNKATYFNAYMYVKYCADNGILEYLEENGCPKPDGGVINTFEKRSISISHEESDCV
jgi:hypothetical protein